MTRATLAAAIASLVLPTVAAAEPARQAGDIWTLTGFLSGGAYEAGILAELLKPLENEPAAAQGREYSFATTSAGAVNALAAGIAACSTTTAGHESARAAAIDRMKRAWLRVTLDRLAPGDTDCEAYRAAFPDVAVQCHESRGPFSPQDGLVVSGAWRHILDDIAMQLTEPPTAGKWISGCAVNIAMSVALDAGALRAQAIAAKDLDDPPGIHGIAMYRLEVRNPTKKGEKCDEEPCFLRAVHLPHNFTETSRFDPIAVEPPLAANQSRCTGCCAPELDAARLADLILHATSWPLLNPMPATIWCGKTGRPPGPGDATRCAEGLYPRQGQVFDGVVLDTGAYAAAQKLAGLQANGTKRCEVGEKEHGKAPTSPLRVLALAESWRDMVTLSGKSQPVRGSQALLETAAWLGRSGGKVSHVRQLEQSRAGSLPIQVHVMAEAKPTLPSASQECANEGPPPRTIADFGWGMGALGHPLFIVADWELGRARGAQWAAGWDLPTASSGTEAQNAPPRIPIRFRVDQPEIQRHPWDQHLVDIATNALGKVCGRSFEHGLTWLTKVGALAAGPGERPMLFRQPRAWFWATMAAQAARLEQIERESAGATQPAILAQWYATTKLYEVATAIRAGRGSVPPRVAGSSLVANLERIALPFRMTHLWSKNEPTDPWRYEWHAVSLHRGDLGYGALNGALRFAYESPGALGDGRHRLGPGIEFGWQGDWLNFALGTDLLLATQRYGPRWQLGVTSTLTLVGHIAVQGVWRPSLDQTDTATSWSVGFGVEDFGGLAYWLLRTVTGRSDPLAGLGGTASGLLGN